MPTVTDDGTCPGLGMLAVYAAADQVVVVSEGLRGDLLRRGMAPEQAHTIRNGVDLEQFTPASSASSASLPERDRLRARLGAGPGDCLALYAGTHGISQALSSIADAAALLDGRPIPGGAIRFAFVGDGADKNRLQRRVAELGLGNATLLPGVPNGEMPALLAAADICLVPLRKVPLRKVPLPASTIPPKMFECLAAGRAVVGSVAGEAARILAEAGAVVVPPQDSGSLASAIAALAADPQLRAEIGRVGRVYVERRHGRAALAREYRKLLLPAGYARPAVPGTDLTDTVTRSRQIKT